MSSISSIPPFIPVKAPEPIEPKAPDPKTDVSAEDTSAPQPTVQARFRRDRERGSISSSEPGANSNSSYVGWTERASGPSGPRRFRDAGPLSSGARSLPGVILHPTTSGMRTMPDTRTYTGGCHCGMVRFECTTDLAMVTACNCSICTKKGLHFAFLAPQYFQLRAGEDNLKEYLFNKHAIRHQLCIDCGVEVFARGRKPDGSEVVALNVSCIDGIDLAKLTMTPLDGRNS